MPQLSPDMESCSLAEYDYYLEERVLENELSLQGLYVFMSKAVFGAEAVRCPARIQSQASEEDLFIVKFSLLTEALKPALTCEGTMSDGLLSGDGSGYNLINKSYFRLSGLTNSGEDDNIKVSENVTRLITPNQLRDRVAA